MNVKKHVAPDAFIRPVLDVLVIDNQTRTMTSFAGSPT